ncbi:hypothetical protein QTP86_031094, partial [Hemibagrus guttatus]
ITAEIRTDRSLDMRESSRDDVSMECEYANWEKPRNSWNANKQEPQLSGGDTVWSRCSRLTVVCAALLCVLLLSVAIVQSVKLNNMTGERDWLQIRYDNMSVERDQLHAERDELQKMQKKLNYTIKQRLRYFVTKRMGWNEARQECRSREADLVIINSREEQEYLSQMVTGEAWIGLSDSAEEGKWMWVDDYTIKQRLRYFVTKRMGWNEARQECRSRGADLVIINSREEQVVILEYLSQMVTGEAWIGLSDSAEEGKWMWVDGTTMTTGFWWQGEPNDYDGIEDCAATGSKFAEAEVTTWADYPCGTKLHAICEKKGKRLEQKSILTKQISVFC